MNHNDWRIDARQCRMARAALNWTIPELAAEAGVHTATVQMFELGSDPRVSTLDKIMRAFRDAGVEFPDRQTVRYAGAGRDQIAA
jgi:transcriptional regulator with XRE-family HTH domain